MSHSKKSVHSWRYGFFNLVLGLMFSIYPLFILKSFLYAFCYIVFICTLSSFNVNIINKKQFLFSFPSSLICSDETKSDRYSSKKVEKKEFSFLSSSALLIPSVLLYYIICVFFGAPLFESYTSTLYFSCLMTLLTVYPLIWHFYMTDSISSIFRILQDNKFDNTIENHLHILIIWSIIGAWLGAIPIPLDWDRPWQEWPITCCIGASLGSSVAHFFIGSRVLFNLFREKKKILLKSV